jgi:hypothetical protein
MAALYAHSDTPDAHQSPVALTAFIGLAVAGTGLARRSTGETVDDGVADGKKVHNFVQVK